MSNVRRGVFDEEGPNPVPVSRGTHVAPGDRLIFGWIKGIGQLLKEATPRNCGLRDIFFIAGTLQRVERGSQRPDQTGRQVFQNEDKVTRRIRATFEKWGQSFRELLKLLEVLRTKTE